LYSKYCGNSFEARENNSCGNYRGINFHNSEYKPYSAIFAYRIRFTVEAMVLEQQSGYRRGGSAADNTFILRQLLGKRTDV
jgi:hypothetical protein